MQQLLEEDRGYVAKMAVERLPAMLRAGGPKGGVAARELRELLVRAALAYLLRQQYPLEVLAPTATSRSPRTSPKKPLPSSCADSTSFVVRASSRPGPIASSSI